MIYIYLNGTYEILSGCNRRIELHHSDRLYVTMANIWEKEVVSMDSDGENNYSYYCKYIYR